MASFILWFLLKLIVGLVSTQIMAANPSRPKPIPPSKYERKEMESNATIDEIIFNVMGGNKVPSNFGKSPLPGGNILAELDMMLSTSQFHRLYNATSSLSHLKKRKATEDVNLRWSNNELVYRFAPNHFSPEEIYHLKRAMTEWERYTCLRFRRADDSDRNVVRIQNGQGCNSQLGMVRGIQALNLETPGCRFKGLYIHELGHAIGLVHEHQLPNRDDYIDILYDNVEPHMKIWFNKYRTDEVNQFDVAYEYSSVMHYGITAFSADQTSQTIRAKYPELEYQIGRVYQKELSFTDTKIVNRMYGCGGSCQNIRCNNGGFVDENCRCVCKDGTNDCQFGAATPDPSCVNSHDSWQCYVWAQQGECEKNPDFMRDGCRRACGVCQGSGEPLPNQCADFYPNDKCEKWAEYGDCVSNENWMSANCKMTCKACSSSDTSHINCNNIHANQEECEEWARKGECYINLDWMFDNCKKSCKMCDKTEKPTTGDENDDEDGVCINNHDDAQCGYWAKDGECDKNPDWMKVNCKKACLVCTRGGECVDLYDSQSCEFWANDAECEKNPVWMKENCRKSCDACEMSETCDNSHDSSECDAWASRGECLKNPSWMLKNCKKSCSVCKTACSPGSYSSTGGPECFLCPIGTYQPSTGQTSCMSCPDGLKTPNAGSISKEACGNGVSVVSSTVSVILITLLFHFLLDKEI